jgi:hypothetical protein
MRLLLDLFVESQEADTGHLHHLETHTRDITDGMTLTAETSDQDLIVVIYREREREAAAKITAKSAVCSTQSSGRKHTPPTSAPKKKRKKTYH